MSADTLVFIPAWNEEESLPEVLAEARRDLPDVQLLVVDDGSTDATARVAAEGGATGVSFPENRGLRQGIAEGYRRAADGGYAFCGRLDADGQHPAAELARMLAMVRAVENGRTVGVVDRETVLQAMADTPEAQPEEAVGAHPAEPGASAWQ